MSQCFRAGQASVIDLLRSMEEAHFYHIRIKKIHVLKTIIAV